MGGIDWSGLPYIVEFFGINDMQEFIAAIAAIKNGSKKDEEK